MYVGSDKFRSRADGTDWLRNSGQACSYMSQIKSVTGCWVWTATILESSPFRGKRTDYGANVVAIFLVGIAIITNRTFRQADSLFKLLRLN
jgi:hypothetical protein